MIYMYDQYLLEYAARKIGDMYRWGVLAMGFDIDEFQRLFQKSGIADVMAQGNPHYILNLFGHEIAEEVLWNLGWKEMPSTGDYLIPEDGPERWAGEIAARLQHRECISFKDLHDLLPMSELAALWPNYMGYDPSLPVEDMENLLLERGLYRAPSWLEWCRAFGYTVPPDEAGRDGGRQAS